MSDPKLPARVYGEKEIGRILQRATELQHDEPTAPATGMTLAELEEIAAEAGIDPRLLRRAARELETTRNDGSLLTRVVGDEVVLVRETTLAGELDEEGFERVVAAIQMSSRDHGQPSLLGRTLTWRSETPTKTRTMQVVVTSRAGETHVRLEENLTQTAVGWMAGMTAGVGVGVGVGVGLPMGIEVLGSMAFAIAAPVGTAVLSAILARAIYRSLVHARRSAVDRLFDVVVEEARAAISAADRALPPSDT